MGLNRPNLQNSNPRNKVARLRVDSPMKSRTTALIPAYLDNVAKLILFIGTLWGSDLDGQESSRLPRPQEPMEPLPYRSERVRFKNTQAGIELAGTLTIPHTHTPSPAIVLVTGSGPQDRDETIANHKPFLILADHLTRRGIAVLRYDDRGVGDSGGDFETATMLDFVSDGKAAVKFLKNRTDIAPKRIGLLGHSEGGMVLPEVAIALPGEVSFLVLLASPGLNGQAIFYLQDAVQQRARGDTEDSIERSKQRKAQMFAVLKDEPDLDKAARKLRKTMKSMRLLPEEAKALKASGVSLDTIINQQIQLLNNDATRFFLSYDPLPALKQLEVPVLALTGERDLQVPPKENLPLIRAALSGGECPLYSVAELPKLNHLFQTCESGLPEEYTQIQETFAPMALHKISEWIPMALSKTLLKE